MRGEFRVSTEGAGLRLDKLLAEAVPGVSRGAVQRAIRSGAALVDGRTASPSSRVSAGQRVTYCLEESDWRSPAADASLELSVLYEEADALAVDKPAGMVVHPAPGCRDGTLVNALLARYPEIASVGEPGRPGIVHRLDRGTSGVLAVARTERGYAALRPQFAERTADRRYLALAYGSPPERGLVDAPIGRGARKRGRFTVGGVRPRWALTRFRVLERFSVGGVDFALLRVRLETGRTHQIRVHLSHIGFGVVGDSLYGRNLGELLGAERPLLHARRLSFALPSTGGLGSFRAPLPPDFERSLARARAG